MAGYGRSWTDDAYGYGESRPGIKPAAPDAGDYMRSPQTFGTPPRVRAMEAKAGSIGRAFTEDQNRMIGRAAMSNADIRRESDGQALSMMSPEQRSAYDANTARDLGRRFPFIAANPGVAAQQPGAALAGIAGGLPGLEHVAPQVPAAQPGPRIGVAGAPGLGRPGVAICGAAAPPGPQAPARIQPGGPIAQGAAMPGGVGAGLAAPAGPAPGAAPRPPIQNMSPEFIAGVAPRVQKHYMQTAPDAAGGSPFIAAFGRPGVSGREFQPGGVRSLPMPPGQQHAVFDPFKPTGVVPEEIQKANAAWVARQDAQTSLTSAQAEQHRATAAFMQRFGPLMAARELNGMFDPKSPAGQQFQGGLEDLMRQAFPGLKPAAPGVPAAPHPPAIPAMPGDQATAGGRPFMPFPPGLKPPTTPGTQAPAPPAAVAPGGGLGAGPWGIIPNPVAPPGYRPSRAPLEDFLGAIFGGWGNP
ncbi:hypothetical protein [Aquisphaera giovannonii]|uniref:hypothetical protein n=1 Tax=Aquisphaera giovannonii TaxID=406548 RepID=UPI0011E02167|nr:hypothetical protein [Aquisphaera giovannonii]